MEFFIALAAVMKQAQKIIDMHFFLGIGGVVTYKNSGLQPVIEKINLEHIVLETDAPYLRLFPSGEKEMKAVILNL